MKKIYKKPYDAPVAVLVSTNISAVMYQTSLPVADDDEEGGPADVMPWYDNNNRRKRYTTWED